MGLFTGLLTLVLVLDCIFLVLLVLVQLPKKEAGMGAAFGGGTADALLGAGSGNVLTKATKYAATVFLVLALALSYLGSRETKGGKSRLQEELMKAGPAPAAVVPAATNLVLETAKTNAAAPVQPAK